MTGRRVSVVEFQDILRRMGPDLERAVVRGLQAAGLVLQRHVVEQISTDRVVDTGELRNSIDWQPVADGSVVTAKAPHAAPVEHGSRPHFPPIEPLKDWCRRHGMDEGAAFAIAKKIAKDGTPPRRYFAKGMSNAVPAMTEGIIAELRKVKHGRVVDPSSIRRRLRAAVVSASRPKR